MFSAVRCCSILRVLSFDLADFIASARVLHLLPVVHHIRYGSSALQHYTPTATLPEALRTGNRTSKHPNTSFCCTPFPQCSFPHSLWSWCDQRRPRSKWPSPGQGLSCLVIPIPSLPSVGYPASVCRSRLTSAAPAALTPIIVEAGRRLSTRCMRFALRWRHLSNTRPSCVAARDTAAFCFIHVTRFIG